VKSVLLKEVAAKKGAQPRPKSWNSLCGLQESHKMPIGIFQINPIEDSRWRDLVHSHPKSSVFHTVDWLKSLRSTYGYEPLVFTTSPPTVPLTNGIVFCRVRSWLTGHRLVSLPFSDHCEPLCEHDSELQALLQHLETTQEIESLRYLEIRPTNNDFAKVALNHFKPSTSYFLHTVNLRPTTEELFHSLDKDCVQRRIRRAERAGLTEKTGRSEELLKSFYSMFVATRRRHHIPPIPCSWFRNLAEYLNDAIQIRIAYKGQKPIAAILTLRFRDTLYYKYGCSDTRFKRFGATPWLLWRALIEGKSAGSTTFDLGRTEAKNEGLLAFKERWASACTPLSYWKYPERSFIDSVGGWKLNLAKYAFSFMPSPLLKLTGKVVYRHIG
jgi:hypothetical protein